LSTKVVQSHDAHGEVGGVVLIEGPNPHGSSFCKENGIVHHSVPKGRNLIYRSLMEQVPGATLWNNKGGSVREHQNSTSYDVAGSTNLWLLAVIRYFYLHDFIRASQVPRFIYLDWDTVVYVPAPAAWRIFAAADPPIHMASGTGYPPFGTANNIYTAWTNESLRDYVGYIAAQVSLSMPPSCGPKFATLSSTLDDGNSGKEHASKADINTYSDMLQLFWYSMHAHRHSMRSPYNPQDRDWLREMPTLANTKRSNFVRCNDSNIACNETSRWHTPPASSPFGAKFPPWHVWPPKYRVFNLYEPFGNGHVIADMPIEGGRTLGTTHSGFHDERVGMSSSLSEELFEYLNVGRPIKDSTGPGPQRAKRFVWGRSPGLSYCAPFSSALKPQSEDSPLWGWENAVPAHELAQTLPESELKSPRSRERRYFHTWAVTFSTPPMKIAVLPLFLLVDEEGRQMPCRSKKGGAALYSRYIALDPEPRPNRPLQMEKAYSK
jgi:hypothetical protein